MTLKLQVNKALHKAEAIKNGARSIKKKLLGETRLGARLMIAFLSVALFSAGVGAYSVFTMSAMRNQTQSIFENNGNQEYLARIDGDIKAYRALIFESLQIADPAKFQENFKEMNATRQSIYQNLDKLSARMQSSPEKLKIFTEFSGSIRIVETKADEIISKAQTDKAAAAVLMMNDESNKCFTDEFSAMDALLNANTAEATKAMAEQQKTSAGAIALAAGLSCAAVALAILLGLAISRSISNPIRALVRVSDNAAAGNLEIAELSGSILRAQRKNEIGRLTESMASVVSAVEDMYADVRMLTEAAIKGELSARADVQRHSGSYRSIVEGINSLLDAVTKPVGEAIETVHALAAGNLKTAMRGEYRGEYAAMRDELNGMAAAFNGYIAEISDVLFEMAKGNFDREITFAYRGDFAALKDSINHIEDAMSGVLSAIRVSSDEVAAGAIQVAEGSRMISQGSVEQAGTIEALLQSVTQVADKTEKNAGIAKETAKVAQAARAEAAAGDAHIRQMQESMADISKAANKISGIIRVIDDIAFQTNILAINAAVEAAHAGTHGKGFAVVAAEVRSLAAKSADAAGRTADIIEAAIKSIEAGAGVADAAADALKNIMTSLNKTADLTECIAEASGEQAKGIATINLGIEQVSRVVQINSVSAGVGATASEELSGQAEMLKNAVARFKLKAENRAIKSA